MIPAVWIAAARRLGIPAEEYAAHRKAGRKWCWRGRHFADKTTFGKNQDRPDGRRSYCRDCGADHLATLPRKPNQSTPESRRLHMLKMREWRLNQAVKALAAHRAATNTTHT